MLRCTLLILALSLCSGCSIIRGRLPEPAAPQSTGVMRAGTARVDITPPPGYPMAGYSISAKIARGVWTRLYARAVHIEDRHGKSLVMVACDLWAIPGGLADRVAELVIETDPTLDVGRDQILLAATHTHNGPGNFSSSLFWNLAATNVGGFDRVLFEFLAARIAASVVRSIHASQSATLEFRRQPLWGIARNRSLEPFFLNPERDAWLANPGGWTPPPDLDDERRAVDPTLSVLTMKGDDGKLLGVAAFYGTHPTAAGLTTELFTSDFFGVGCTLAERRLGLTDEDGPCVALFNGPEGDIAADVDGIKGANENPAERFGDDGHGRRDRLAVLELGRRISDGIVKIVGESDASESLVSGDLSYATEVIGIDDREFIHQDRCVATAEKPLVGAPVLGGAEDARTILYEAGIRAGIKGRRREGHGPKQFALNPLGLPLDIIEDVFELLIPPESHVSRFLGAVYRIGPLVFCALPGEFSTVMGSRIRREVMSHVDEGKWFVPIGLGNEFIYYVTTPDEYEAQHYEGAATLFGPYSGPWISRELGRLAERIRVPGGASTSPPLPRPFLYDAGLPHGFESRDVGEIPPRADDGLGNLAIDLSTRRPKRDFPEFEWCDATPDLEAPGDHSTPVIPDVFLEQKVGSDWVAYAPGGIPENNRGLRFLTISRGWSRTSTRWGAIWLRPDGLAPDLVLRFKARRSDGSFAVSGKI